VWIVLCTSYGVKVNYDAGVGYAFAQAALSTEVLFQAADLLIAQIVGRFDQADDNVRTDFRVNVLDALAESFDDVLFAGAGSLDHLVAGKDRRDLNGVVRDDQFRGRAFRLFTSFGFFSCVDYRSGRVFLGEN
jgi:hypothetical protein